MAAIEDGKHDGPVLTRRPPPSRRRPTRSIERLHGTNEAALLSALLSNWPFGLRVRSVRGGKRRWLGETLAHPEGFEPPTF